MGHRQKMSHSARVAFDSHSYKRMLEERQGHNYAYLTDELYLELLRKGYKEYRDGDSIHDGGISEETAKEIVSKLRSMKNFARIVCISNRLRIKEFHVFFKPKIAKAF